MDAKNSFIPAKIFISMNIEYENFECEVTWYKSHQKTGHRILDPTEFGMYCKEYLKI